MQYSQVLQGQLQPKISGQKPVIEKPGVKAAVTASTTAPTTSLMRKWIKPIPSALASLKFAISSLPFFLLLILLCIKLLNFNGQIYILHYHLYYELITL